MLREMLQCDQRLFEVPHCLSVSRAHGRFDATLPTVYESLVPQLSAKGVVGEPLDLGGQAVGIKPLGGVHNTSVERTPPFLKQASISHILGERMFEGIDELWKEARFIEEFSRLEVSQTRVESGLGQVSNGLQQGQ